MKKVKVTPAQVQEITSKEAAEMGFNDAPAKKLTAAEIKTKNISRTQALELMKNNKGHFFSAVFVTKGNKLRTINGQWLKDQGPSDLGYVKVRETSKLKSGKEAIRNVNLQTLELLKIAGKTFNVG